MEEINDQIAEKRRLAYFFKMSQSRRLRRRMAKELGMMKYGWQNVKDIFAPYNAPMDLGIKAYKRAGHSYQDVLEYKKKAYATFNNNSNK